MSIRIAASWLQPLQERVAPRGAVMWRLRMLMTDRDAQVMKVEI
jgi:hypothetical protein